LDFGKSSGPNTPQSRRLLIPVPQHAIRSLKYCFGPAYSGPGQSSRRHTHSKFFPDPFCGVDPWVTASITPLANPPSWPVQSINLYRMALAGQQACPQKHSSLFLVHLRRPQHPVSHRICSCLSLLSSYLVDSKWSLLHNVEFSDPYGFHSLPVIRKQTLCNRPSLSISFGPVDYSLVAALSRSQPWPRPPACDGSGLRPPSSLITVFLKQSLKGIIVQLCESYR